MFFETDLIRLGRSNQAPSKSGSRLAEDYGVEGHLAALRSPAQLAPASPPPQPPSTPSSPPMKLASIAAFSKVRGNKTAAPAVGADANGGKARHHQHNVDDVLNEDDEDGSPSRNKGHRSKKSKAKSKHRSRSSMRYADAEKPPRRASKLIGRSADSLSTLSGKIQLSMMNSGLLPLSRAEESRAISALTTKPVEMDAFPKYMEQRRRYPVLLKVEFVTATRAVGEGHSTRHGSKSENETKNQNPKIIPYDYNRVVLEKLPGQPDSDYINASYVDSINHPKAYIVTQGPNENTIGDFWRMVWQEHSPCIIMLTKTFDFIKVMCVQYWPAAKGHEEVYGGIGVTVVHEEQLANFLIRTIRLRKDNSERVMKQFHFTEWTCHSCPFPSALLEYRRRIRHYVKFLGVSQAGTGEGNTGPGAANNRKPSVASAAGSPEHNSLLKPGTAASGSSLQLAQSSQKSGSTQNLLPPPNASGRRLSSVAASQVYVPGPAEELTGPLIVHCNDGAGRSGVFLAIDANLCLSEEDGVFCIYPYLKKMKMARKGLVESMDQYKFIYDALEESVICKKTWFPVCELSQRLKTMSMRDPRSKMNEYQEQFLRISKLAAKFSIGDCAGGHRPENREKNRDVIIVPPDNYRPYLTSFQGNACTDYINAVFVDGYTRPREYIVTEWPIVSTVADFWSLVYDYEGAAVVVLCHPEVSSTYPPFWPESSRSRKYGNVFTLDMISKQDYPNIRSWIFRINKKEFLPCRSTISMNVAENQGKKIVSLTELMAGVKAEPKTCQLFQLTCWPEGHKVPLSTNSLVELMNMVERWRAKTDYGPVVVVSHDGCARCGVYCAANACIEQVIQHGEVDVFQAVKTVRRHRPHLVQNMTEYKYCYDLVLHYVLHYLHRT